MGFNPLSRIGSALGRAAGGIADVTGAAARTTIGAIGATASAVVNTTVGVTKAGGEAVAKGATAVADAAVSGGKAVVNTTVDVTKASGEAVAKGVSAVADAAVSGGKAVVNTTVDVTKAGGEAVVKGVSAVADAAVSAVSATGSVLAEASRAVIPGRGPDGEEPRPEYLRAELLESMGGPHPAWLLIGLAVLLVAVAETADFLIAEFRTSPVMGAVWSAALVLFLGGVWMAFRRDRKAMRGLLTQKAVMEETSPRRVRRLLARTELDEGQEEWELECSGLKGEEGAEKVRALYSAMVLEPHLDRQAADIIRRSSLRAGLTVMVSPFALVDMLSVLAISSRMMRSIAETYGIGLSLRAQMRVYAYVIRNISIAGAADLGTDVLSQLGAKWAEILAAKAGQGILAGRYVIRLGILVAMACRPVAFTEGNLISYGDLFTGMLAGMRGKLDAPQGTAENRTESKENA